MRVRYGSSYGSGISPVLVLIIVNLLLYVITAFASSLRPLLWMQPITIFTQPWTILTSMFMHGSFWHIFANMITLYFFGSALLRLVGQGRFLLVYFVGGILGNIFYIVITFLGGASGIGFLGSPFAPVAGASGAIFALAGALVLMTPRLPVIIFPIPIPIPLWVAVIGGFLILSFLPNVAWQAHLGGLLFGLAAGYRFRKRGGYIFY
jgi:membrane associated rhomboid family serine protease